MKTRKTVCCVVLTLGVLFLLSSCATTKTPLPTDNIDELLGAWGNPDYEGPHAAGRWAKYIYKEDGIATLHEYLEGGSLAMVVYLDAKEKWMDHKGAVYFIDFLEAPGMAKTHRLLKISPDRKTLEALEQPDIALLPSEMDPGAPYCLYYIWYHQ